MSDALKNPRNAASPPGATISTGGPWPVAPLANTNLPTGGKSQNSNTGVYKADNQGRIKGTSKVAPQ